jgi:hypothetical protein
VIRDQQTRTKLADLTIAGAQRYLAQLRNSIADIATRERFDGKPLAGARGFLCQDAEGMNPHIRTDQLGHPTGGSATSAAGAAREVGEHPRRLNTPMRRVGDYCAPAAYEDTSRLNVLIDRQRVRFLTLEPVRAHVRVAQPVRLTCGDAA